MIAVPITSETIEDALADIELANKKADVIELRLDFLQDINETILSELLDACKRPVIVTFRQLNHGASIEPTERMFLLHKAIELGAPYIDLDVETDEEFLDDFKDVSETTRIILSHHNFDDTPPLPELLKKMEEMLEKEIADVLKIVTFAREEQDNDTILALVHAAKLTGKPIIAFCMGPKGIKSRIACIKIGALLTFASFNEGKESAAGQLSVEIMREELEND
tara:strand:- start:651 stop:1319 length:669 start_codon:yes stop_codon:yes gene_type:complete